MAPKRKAGPIPAGWTLEAEVRKDGSKVPFYYCQETDQQFDTYFELMRYVRYAKRKGFSIYAQIRKSVKRTRNLEKDNDVTESKKKSALSTQRKPSSKPNSATVELSLDSKPSTSRTDSWKDPGYLPKSVTNVTRNQNLNEELYDQVADD